MTMKELLIGINFVTLLACIGGVAAMTIALMAGYTPVDETSLVIANIALVIFGLWARRNILILTGENK